jgi:hypothetical protein
MEGTGFPHIFSTFEELIVEVSPREEVSGW